MTRGLLRLRRGGSRRSSSSARVALTVRASLPGGKCRLVDDLAAHDPQGAGERDPVGVVVAVLGGLVHQAPDRVMDQQKAVQLLLGAVGVLRAQHQVRPAEVGLDLVQVDSNSQRWA